MNREALIQTLINLVYTPDAKPRFINNNWVNTNDFSHLRRLEETADKIIKGFKPTELEKAGELLSYDTTEELQKMVNAIKEHTSKGNGDDFIDWVDEVTPWENLEYRLTCDEFLEQIKISD